MVTENKSYKFQVLESLRGYMAWWVVLGHALQLAGFMTPNEVREYFSSNELIYKVLAKLVNFFIHAHSAVNVFIILSGFVITHLLLVKHESYKNFILRRYFRLAPALYISLALAIFVTSLYKIAYTGLTFSGDTSMRVARLAEQENHFIAHLFNHLILIHGFFPQEVLPFSPTTFLAPAWSIGLEWQFYLIAPFLLMYLKRSQSAIIITTFALLIARYYFLYQSGLDWQYNSFFFKVPDYFLVGILSRLIIERINNQKQFVDIIILLAGLMFLQDPYSTYIWLFILGVVFYEMGHLSFDSPLMIKVINILFLNNLIASIGKWSYSTYLIHIPIFSLLVGGFAFLMNPITLSRQNTLIILLISLPIVLLISKVMFQYIELPSMNYISRKLKSTKLIKV